MNTFKLSRIDLIPHTFDSFLVLFLFSVQQAERTNEHTHNEKKNYAHLCLIYNIYNVYV